VLGKWLQIPSFPFG
jgi:fructose-1,6-bisphosphatase I